jgi:hypothetical protein
MAVAAAKRVFGQAPDTSLDVVDFGCAEGAMLEDLTLALGTRFRSGRSSQDALIPQAGFINLSGQGVCP